MSRSARQPNPAVEVCQAQCIHPAVVAQATIQLGVPETYQQVAALFGALADPTRAKLVHALLGQELCTCDLAAVLGVSASAVSQHLRVLRALRLVRARRAGKFVYYSVDDAHVTLLMRIGLTHAGHSASGSASGSESDSADNAVGSVSGALLAATHEAL